VRVIVRAGEGLDMAQKVEVRLIDDLTGETADATVSFSLDGAQYEIDLSAANASKLRDEVARFVHAARKTGGRRIGRGTGRGRKYASGGSSTREVRQWAKDQGIQVNERGRIPADVVVKIEEAKTS
jgi:hypothetical protein